MLAAQGAFVVFGVLAPVRADVMRQINKAAREDSRGFFLMREAYEALGRKSVHPA